MNARNVCAFFRIFHGTMTQQDTTAAMKHPRLMLMYLGAMTHRSLAAEMELPVMFVPTWAMNQLNEAKNAAALPACPFLSHCSTMFKGFQ
jgi:hypothetical protein